MIHKYKLDGCNIVLDVNSGAVHLFDDLSFLVLDYIDEDMRFNREEFTRAHGKAFDRNDIAETLSEIEQLCAEGQLFTKDQYSRWQYSGKDAPVKAMCLHVAHDCNLRCEYCFAAKGDFGLGRKLMDFETGRRAIDFLLEHSAGRRNLEVDFFGGEPLMNFSVVRKIVSYARSLEEEYGKTFRFTITTNGLFLDEEKIGFINREMSNVVLSIDGRREVNDRLRVTKSGTGSYDIILDKYKRLLDSRGGKDYYVRGTFTKLNRDFTDDVLHLYKEGFNQISVEPVVSDETFSHSLTEEDLPAIKDEYERLAKELLTLKQSGSGINFFHFMLDFDHSPCAIKRIRGCGCGNEYLAVTPEGDIYPCHQFVGMEEWKMGSLYGDPLDTKIKDLFHATTIYAKDECRDCWARFFCSGGCNANNWQYAGRLLQNHTLSCELEKKRLECAIMIKAKLAFPDQMFAVLVK